MQVQESSSALHSLWRITDNDSPNCGQVTEEKRFCVELSGSGSGKERMLGCHLRRLTLSCITVSPRATRHHSARKGNTLHYEASLRTVMHRCAPRVYADATVVHYRPTNNARIGSYHLM